MIDEPIAWSLCHAPVIIANDAHFSQKFSPVAEHRLLVKKVLEQLSNQPRFKVPSTVTVDTLPWPIKAIVEPNNGRIPRWATHVKHRHLADTGTDVASPFVFIDRDLRLPVTKSLTIELIGTNDHPVINDIYPGRRLPPMPWQVSPFDDLRLYVQSVIFWRSHSFLYDKGCVADTLHDAAPKWYDYLTSSALPPQ